MVNFIFICIGYVATWLTYMSQVTPLCNTEEQLQYEFSCCIVDTACLALLNFFPFVCIGFEIWWLPVVVSKNALSLRAKHSYKNTPNLTQGRWTLRWIVWHIVCTIFCNNYQFFLQTISHLDHLKDEHLKKGAIINHNIPHPALTHTLRAQTPASWVFKEESKVWRRTWITHHVEMSVKKQKESRTMCLCAKEWFHAKPVVDRKPNDLGPLVDCCSYPFLLKDSSHTRKMSGK